MAQLGEMQWMGKLDKKRAAGNPLSAGRPRNVLSFSPKVEDTKS
jgi:hypothetical protein